MTGSARRSPFLVLAAVLVTTMAALTVTEIMLRVINPIPLSGIHYAPCNLTPSREFKALYIPNSRDRHTRLNEYDLDFVINNLGFHDRNRVPSQHGTFRIAVVGDSFTAARQVEIDETWTRRLEELLRGKLSKPAEVINLGISGTGTAVHARIVEKYASLLRPDLFIHVYTIGDKQDDSLPGLVNECHRNFLLTYQDPAARRPLIERADEISRNGWWGAVVAWSFAARAINYHAGWWPTTNVLRQSDLGFEWRIDRSAIQTVLRLNQMKKAVTAAGGKFVTMPMPLKGLGSASEPIPVDSREEVSADLKAADITMIDIRDALFAEARRRGVATKSFFWKFDGHYNVEGNDALGNVVADHLVRQGWVK